MSAQPKKLDAGTLAVIIRYWSEHHPHHDATARHDVMNLLGHIAALEADLAQEREYLELASTDLHNHYEMRRELKRRVRKCLSKLPGCVRCSRPATKTFNSRYYCDDHHISLGDDVIWANAIRALEASEGER